MTKLVEPISVRKDSFTFTFICHLGKTHNHRSRGDTPWKAQTKSGRNLDAIVKLINHVAN